MKINKTKIFAYQRKLGNRKQALLGRKLFGFCQNRHQSNSDNQKKEKNIANGQIVGGVNCHFSPFLINITAKTKLVKETAIPQKNWSTEGFTAAGKTLGKKYPATLYKATAFDKSSQYLESSLYWEGVSFILIKQSLTRENFYVNENK
jgi:hypothetical protein